MRVRAPQGEGQTEIQYTQGQEEDSVICMRGLYFPPVCWLLEENNEVASCG